MAFIDETTVRNATNIKQKLKDKYDRIYGVV